MRPLAFIPILVMVLASLLFADTQQELYMRGLQAEEAENIPEALDYFERAVVVGGEYTEEIREIIKLYYEALGMAKDSTGSFSFRVLGDVGFYGLHYAEFGRTDASENGGDLFGSASVFVDYSIGDWIHSLGVAFVSEWFFANKDMPVLDTNDWTLAPGLEYSLVGNNLLLDVGADFNISDGGEFSLSLYGWLEYDILRFGKQRLGAAALGYYHDDGPVTAALYVAWHRTEAYGFSGNVYLGAKYEADYMVNVLDYVQQLEQEGWNNNNGYDPGMFQGYGSVIPADNYWTRCVEEHGDSVCMDYSNGILQTYIDQYWAEQQELWNQEQPQTGEVELSRYWSRWIGPTLRAKLMYKFRNKISLEAKLNLFGAVLFDGASEEFEKMGKFSGTWGLMFTWSPNWLTIYAGLEQLYLDYWLPESLVDYFPDRSLLTSLKTGVKVEF